MNPTGKYYAHSTDNLDYSKWQRLDNHLIKVGELAGNYADVFGCKELANATGRLHDLGKYSIPFDARLHGGKSVDHATAGAKIAIDKWQQDNGQKMLAKMVAFAVAGHHAGLANGLDQGNKRSTLRDRLSLEFGQDIPVLDKVWRSEISLPEKLPLPKFKGNKDKSKLAFTRAFSIRMLYSCLVDADFLDTQRFYDAKDIEDDAAFPNLEILSEVFQKYLHKFDDAAPTSLNKLRHEILTTAQGKAALPPGLFSLTVPTGGGKTLTSMGFALKHALSHQLRRIIYVIPYTSIIEQNAQVFREAFGAYGEAAVLEHHATFDDSKIKNNDTRDKLRHASENWSAPIVVTTAVQFFESLFADRSSKCRKLHNIAGSVIILDEAQMMPLTLLTPSLFALDELARNYHCSIVLCTATQPAIRSDDGFYHGLENIRELTNNPLQLFDALKRTTIKEVGIKSDAELLDLIQQNEQLLIIVNSRRHARALYDACVENEVEHVFHLTTLMCAAHRQQVLAEIRKKLQQGESCRLISTSLIECGVDISFPFLMREQTGLDSVAQAAGRCNREGLFSSEESQVWVFNAEKKWKIPPALQAQAPIMRETIRNCAGEPLSMAAMKTYFSKLYRHFSRELDKKRIIEMHKAYCNSLDFPFQNIAQEYQLIEDNMVSVIVPFDAIAKKEIERLCNAPVVGKSMRILQPYTVPVPQRVLEILVNSGRIDFLNPTIFGQQFPYLIELGLYDSVAGLSWEEPDRLSVEQTVL